MQLFSMEMLGFISFCVLLKLFIFKLAKITWNNFLGYHLGAGVRWSPDGTKKWAVVTGSTDGIGLEYARQLADRGYPVMLVARSEDKLNRVKQQLENTGRCPEVRTVVVDFAKTDTYWRVQQAVDQLLTSGHRVDVLVNNVGMNIPGHDFFGNLNIDKVIDLINCNMTSCVKMTQLVLPSMVEVRQGVIINVSSIAADAPIPLAPGVYSASKVFVDQFSRSLHDEYKEKGIVIQSVRPGYVSTKLVDHPQPGAFVATSDQYVSAAIKTVGVEKMTHGWWQHKLQGFAIQLFQRLFFFEDDAISRMSFNRLINQHHKSS